MIYNDELQVERQSILTGGEKINQTDSIRRLLTSDLTPPVVKAFLQDNDLQEMTVCSSNIGLVNTYRKSYLPS